MTDTTDTTKTRKSRTPKPINAMLEGGFGTALENRIAAFNNTLALEGRLTNDPAYVMLRDIKRELVTLGVATFSRVAQAVQEATTTESPAPKSRRKGAEAAAAPVAGPVRVIEGTPEEKDTQVAQLQVADSISEATPYGRDSEGAALAPYGVKKSGIPMKRRGKRAAPASTTPVTQEASSAEDTTEVEEEEEATVAEASSDTEEEEEATVAEASSDTEEEDTDEDVTSVVEEEEEEEEEEDDVTEENIDDLLENFDI